jgi:HSP90 family molecular chaperone
LQVFDVVVDEVAIKEARKIRDAEFAKITKARAEKEAAEEAAAIVAREEEIQQEAEATIAMEEEEEVVEDEDAPPSATPTASTADSFWKDTSSASASTRKDLDSTWPDEGDVNEEEEGASGTAAAISLVSIKATRKRPSSRPRFLSRKRKGKS